MGEGEEEDDEVALGVELELWLGDVCLHLDYNQLSKLSCHDTSYTRNIVPSLPFLNSLFLAYFILNSTL